MTKQDFYDYITFVPEHVSDYESALEYIKYLRFKHFQTQSVIEQFLEKDVEMVDDIHLYALECRNKKTKTLVDTAEEIQDMFDDFIEDADEDCEECQCPCKAKSCCF